MDHVRAGWLVAKTYVRAWTRGDRRLVVSIGQAPGETFWSAVAQDLPALATTVAECGRDMVAHDLGQHPELGDAIEAAEDFGAEWIEGGRIHGAVGRSIQ